MLLLVSAGSTVTTLLRDSKIKSKAPVDKSDCSENCSNAEDVEMMPDYIGQNYNRSGATQKIMSLVKKDINLNESAYALNSRRLKKDTDSSQHTASLKNVENMSNEGSGKMYTTKFNRTKKPTVPIHALPPSIYHKQVEKYRDLECCNGDELTKEMCHFRPIRLAPVSPWKCGINTPRRGVILIPKSILGKGATKRNKKVMQTNSVTNSLLKTQSLHSLLPIAPKSAFVSTIKEHTTETEQPKRRRTSRSTTNSVKSMCDLTLSNKPNKDSRNSRAKPHPSKDSNKQGRKKKNVTKKTTSSTSSPPLTRSRLRELRKKNLSNSLQYFGL